MTTAIANLAHFPLSRAHLCLDCQAVHNSNAYCPACSSSAIVTLTRWVFEMAETVKKA
jgi:hypothetical protein